MSHYVVMLLCLTIANLYNETLLNNLVISKLHSDSSQWSSVRRSQSPVNKQHLDVMYGMMVVMLSCVKVMNLKRK